MNSPDRATKRILIVDDEPSIRQVCLRILTTEGYKVDVAVNGRVAQDMIDEERYDCCLIDIRTPEMNGMELYQWLQKKYPQLAGRVIFTSGETMSEDIGSFLEQSGRPFLPKPFTTDELTVIFQETLKQMGK